MKPDRGARCCFRCESAACRPPPHPSTHKLSLPGPLHADIPPKLTHSTPKTPTHLSVSRRPRDGVVVGDAAHVEVFFEVESLEGSGRDAAVLAPADVQLTCGREGARVRCETDSTAPHVTPMADPGGRGGPDTGIIFHPSFAVPRTILSITPHNLCLSNIPTLTTRHSLKMFAIDKRIVPNQKSSLTAIRRVINKTSKTKRQNAVGVTKCLSKETASPA